MDLSYTRIKFSESCKKCSAAAAAAMINRKSRLVEKNLQGNKKEHIRILLCFFPYSAGNTYTRALWGGPTGEKKKNSPLDYHLIYTSQGMQTIRD
jgi:hypothetical protein